MYFRNLPRSINSHRKTHNGPLFAPISTIRIFQRYSVYRTKNNCWLEWQWKKRIIHRIGTIYFSDQNWSNPRCFDYIYTHRFVHMKSIFEIFLFDFPDRCVRRFGSSLAHRTRSPFFEHVLISPSFVFYPIWKSCIIDRVKSKCLTPIEIPPTRERNRYARGERG